MLSNGARPRGKQPGLLDRLNPGRPACPAAQHNTPGRPAAQEPLVLLLQGLIHNTAVHGGHQVDRPPHTQGKIVLRTPKVSVRKDV